MQVSLDFNFPWHDCLQPIGKNYLAVERSVLECAFAGCDTIWVVCHDDMQPLIKSRLGDYVQDPVYIYRKYDPGNIKENQRRIPIYYVPIHPKDRDKRDCLAWSVLHGANISYKISQNISKWANAVSNIMSHFHMAYMTQVLRKDREQISSKNSFFVSYNNKTVGMESIWDLHFDEEEYKNIEIT